jgi:erythromycin esterase
MTDDSTHSTDAPTTEQTDALADRATPLAGTAPRDDRTDLAPLGDALADAAVVGLGEPSHGAREVFDLKRRVVRHLVADRGFRTVALEADHAAARPLERYVHEGDGDPAEALRALDVWPWKCESLAGLARWCRGFNEGRPPDDRVRLVGVDADRAAAPAGAVREFLAEHDRGRGDETLATLAAAGLRDDGEVVPDRVAAARDRLPAVERRLDSAVADGVDGAERVRQHARELRWATEMAGHLADDELPAMLELRDRAMAETVRWWADRDPGDGVAVWAHTQHLRRGTRSASRPARDWSGVPATGRFLADALGDDYRVFAVDAGGGRVRALAGERDFEMGTWPLGPAPRGSLTRALAAVGDTVHAVDLRAPDGPLTALLDRPRALRSLGAVWWGEGADAHHDAFRFPAEVDALAFVDAVSPTTLLDGVR